MINPKGNNKPDSRFPARGKLLAAGIASVTAGLLLFAVAFSKFDIAFSTVAPMAVLVVCGVVLYRAFMRRARSLNVFLGLYGFLCSLLFLLAGSGIFLFRLAEFWPLLVLICGVCLLASGFYGKKRLTISYMIPALLLIALGVFFLLFSTDIIQMTLSSFVAKWLPLGLVLTGIVLVILFFSAQAIPRGLVIKDEADDSDDLQGGD
jgi:hypothetical protein